MKNNIFEEEAVSQITNRINKLSAQAKPNWGKMNVGQMLAHCNVTYEMVYTDKHPKPGSLKKFMLKTFVKNIVVSDKPYAKNGRTAPEFIMTDAKDFESEKQRLVNHLAKTKELGEAHFDGRESHSFGKLSKQEWNNMFYKHLDHHLTQFGAI